MLIPTCRALRQAGIEYPVTAFFVKIRKAVPSDADAVCALHRASIRGLCSADYSPEQIAAWIEPFAPERYVSLMQRFEFFVAEEESVVGFLVLDLEGGEVNALYLHPHAASRGIGRRLMEHAENLARERALATLHVKSTLNAVGFYEACPGSPSGGSRSRRRGRKRATSRSASGSARGAPLLPVR